MSNNFTVRKNVDALSDTELQNLRTVYSKMMQIADNRGYSFIAGIHGRPQGKCMHDPVNVGGVFEARLFLPWHRAYLYTFEKALQDQVQGVTVPFWDWRIGPGQLPSIPLAFSIQTVNGQPNTFFAFHMKFGPKQPIDRDTRRFPGSAISPDQTYSLPTPDDITNLINQNSHFDDFSDALQNIHNSIHMWTGGSTIINGKVVSGDMTDLSYAAFDPIFWSHHCMIDRVWWMWQQQYGINQIDPDYLTLALEPFSLTVNDVLDIYKLGYEYAGTQTVVGGTTQ
jgi:tyrosinase